MIFIIYFVGMALLLFVWLCQQLGLIWTIVCIAMIILYFGCKLANDIIGQRRSLVNRLNQLLVAEQIALKELHQTFVAVDCETTGLKSAESRIIQVALVLFKNGKRVGSRNWLLNPRVTIPPSATKVNKITDEMVKSKPSFKEIHDEILKLSIRYPLVGHNLSFDYSILQSEFNRLGVQFEPKILYCTMKDTTDIFHDNSLREASFRPKWKKLAAAAAEIGLFPHGELHDALTDADLSGRLYIEKKKKEADLIRREIDKIESKLKYKARKHRS